MCYWRISYWMTVVDWIIPANCIEVFDVRWIDVCSSMGSHMFSSEQGICFVIKFEEVCHSFDAWFWTILFCGFSRGFPIQVVKCISPFKNADLFIIQPTCFFTTPMGQKLLQRGRFSNVAWIATENHLEAEKAQVPRDSYPLNTRR